MTEADRLAAIKRGIAYYGGEDPEEPEPMTDTNIEIRFGGAIKAAGTVISGLLVPFGAPDDLDHDGEFFSAKSDYGIRMPGAVKLHYAHGQNKKVGAVPLAWAHLEKTEQGIKFTADLAEDLGDEWLEGEREEARKYQAYTLRLAQEGLLGASSGAAGHLVQRRAAGKGHELLRWPIAEASLTPRPANPMTVGVSVKSLGELPDPEALLQSIHNLPEFSVKAVLAPGLDFTEKAGRVVAISQEFAAHAADKHEARTKAGRVFSQRNLDALAAVHSQLGDLLALAQPKSEDDPSEASPDGDRTESAQLTDDHDAAKRETDLLRTALLRRQSAHLGVSAGATL